jgi:hypothetical protein
MIKMYLTVNYSDEMTERVFVKVSDKSVFWINEKTGKQERALILSNYHRWHKSKQDAINYLKERMERQMKYGRELIKDAETRLLKIAEYNAD